MRGPTRVRELASLALERPWVRSVLYGSHLYLVSGGQPIGVVDISDPLDTRWFGELSDVDETLRHALVGDVLWVLRDLRSTTL